MNNSKQSDKLLKITELLLKKYKDIGTALNYNTPYELLVATVLAAQCTDKRVNMITPLIFKKYKNVYGFAKAKQDELEQEIRSLGFFRNKSKNIIALSKKIIEDFNSIVPDTMEKLITLPGVARKTANIVLSSCFGKAEGIAVDTHVARLSNRLGFSKNTDPNKIEKDLMQIIPKKYWIKFNYVVVEHGRNICKARNPLCKECFLMSLCPYVKCHPELRMSEGS
jgi:endonuclease III